MLDYRHGQGDVGMTKLLALAILMTAGPTPAAAQLQDGPIEIPLRAENGRLFVPVMAPDGTELQFVLSTGTGVTVFSESLAARLEGHTGLTMGGIPVVTDGSATLPDERLTVDGKVLDGMIGANTLNQYDVLVDLPAGRLVLKEIGRSVEWEGMTLSEPIPLLVLHGVALGLSVELNGTPYRAMLDLGTPAIIVSERVQADTDLDADDVGDLTLGQSTLRGVSVQVKDLEVMRRWDPSGNGFVLVGAPIAFDCAISISWVHQEVRTCLR